MAMIIPQPGAAPKLPKLRQDLKLREGPTHRDGSPSWRIHDPVRNRFFEIGWLEFELLARWNDHDNVHSLVEDVMAATTLEPHDEDVDGFIRFLVHNQLTVPERGAERGELRARWMKAHGSWWSRAFHRYLFIRIPLLRPDAFLDRTLPLVEIFFTRAFLAVLLVIFVADLYLLTREWDELRRSFGFYFNLEGGLYFALAATCSKIVHELAHAYAAKRYGVRVPTIGIALMVLWPFLYTDVGETWKLNDRRKQLVIASAGVASELALAIIATLLWALTPEGPTKQVLFVLATTTWVITLAMNLSPFMRFDGYFVLSDIVDFPNLHERGSAAARWWIRSRFFGLEEPLPEPTLTVSQRVWLVVFALITWAYRLVVFLGIALLVYYLFFKVLGVILLVLELWWFIAKPVYGELGYLWGCRKQWRLRLVPFAMVGFALLVLVWMVPVAREVNAPAVRVVAHEQAVFAPFAARLSKVNVRQGERVAKGTVLFELEAPELQMRAERASITLSAAQFEYIRASANTRLQEQQRIFLERVAQAYAELRAVNEEMSRLVVRAEMDGVVRDLARQIVPGRWVGSRELLARIIEPAEPVIEAYVGESRIESVKIGQPVTYIPAVVGGHRLEGTVIQIDTIGSRKLRRLILSSSHGGDVAAIFDKKDGVAVANEPVYRVLVRPVAHTQDWVAIERGTVRIETDLEVLAQNFLSRAVSIFIRESAI